MTVLEVIQRSTEFLQRKGIDSPRLNVELLLGHALKVPRLRLYLDFERQLTDSQLDAIRELVKRRAGREPLQHIVGSTSFCGLELIVNPDVLIPRPETEVLAERAWQFLRARSREPAGPLTALDIGTGSGCLAIALAHHVPGAQIDAVDLSEAALAVARENAARHQVLDRVHFFHGNGFAPIPAEKRFDLVVSNPPYIPSSEIAHLAPEVRDHDPRLALDGGADGLDVLRRLAVEAPAYLKPGGGLMCEFGDGQGEAVSRLFSVQQWVVEMVVPDLSGRARILVARGAESWKAGKS